MSADADQLLGENYFIRAIAHLHLSTLYSRPYTRGREYSRPEKDILERGDGQLCQIVLRDS